MPLCVPLNDLLGRAVRRMLMARQLSCRGGELLRCLHGAERRYSPSEGSATTN